VKEKKQQGRLKMPFVTTKGEKLRQYRPSLNFAGCAAESWGESRKGESRASANESTPGIPMCIT
jgi:hypothetical protein